MQYKIPINIENEDPIIWWLSIRQLIIIFWWWGIWYACFTSLQSLAWTQIAAIPSILFVILWIFIAIFKYSEMTFMVFLFAWLRLFVNQRERYWQKWVDSFSALDIWYIIDIQSKVEKIEYWNKAEKIKNLEEQLEKI